MGRAGVVHLEAGSQRTLGKGVWVVAQEGVVIAEERIADGGVGVSDEQILVLCNDLQVRGWLEPGPMATHPPGGSPR